MTPEECARFLLSDCQDPDLRAKADRENDAALAESLKRPGIESDLGGRICKRWPTVSLTTRSRMSLAR